MDFFLLHLIYSIRSSAVGELRISSRNDAISFQQAFNLLAHGEFPRAPRDRVRTSVC